MDYMDGIASESFFCSLFHIMLQATTARAHVCILNVAAAVRWAPVYVAAVTEVYRGECICARIVSSYTRYCPRTNLCFCRVLPSGSLKWPATTIKTLFHFCQLATN